MTEFVYLMKNGDLYQLGSTKNLQAQADKLKPGEIIASLELSESKPFEARLLRRYKRKRIPETNYFRLSEKELEDCKKQLGEKSNVPNSLGEEITIGLNGSLLFGLLVFLFSFVLKKMLIFSLFVSILSASLPMWSIAIFGGFGGYDINDLPLLSTTQNRLKGFFIAISMDSISYVLFKMSHFSFNS